MVVSEEDEALLDRLEMFRRSVNLRLDGEGRWFHDGEPFTHSRLVALFNRGIDLHPETGAPILRVGARWCYISAESTPFFVRRLHFEAGALCADLNTEQTVKVEADGLRWDGDRLFVGLVAGREARLDRRAQAAVADLLIEVEGGFALEDPDGRRWPIASS